MKGKIVSDDTATTPKDAYARFTDSARLVMQLANQEARRLNHHYIGTEHILLGLCKENSGLASTALDNLGADIRRIRLETERLVVAGSSVLPLKFLARKVIEYAMEEAHSFKDSYIGTEHLLLGLIREEDGVAVQVLRNLGITAEKVREEVLRLLSITPPEWPSQSDSKTYRIEVVVPDEPARYRVTVEKMMGDEGYDEVFMQQLEDVDIAKLFAALNGVTLTEAETD